MPHSLILRTVALGLLFVIMIFSIHVFLEGHNAPGGGFIAGLIAGAMILIQYLSFSKDVLHQTFRPIFHRMIGVGVLFAAGSGFFGFVADTAFLDGFHWEFALPAVGHVAIPSVLFFDLGVYLVVVGMVVSIFLALEERVS